MLNFMRRAAETRSQARRLCAGLMERARAPVFFTELCVPDTMDGRFDLVALHAWLVLDRIAGEPQLTQALIDRQVVPDFRTPDRVRLGPAPLYTRFVDIWDAMQRFREVLETGAQDKYPAERARVT